MSDKILTIITVTKNCVQTIERTIKSVELAKSSKVEYVVIDGVSDDGTLEVIKKYSETIDCVISEPDTGIYNAMNKGVTKANGDFVLFINGDDELIPDGVNKVLALLPSCKEKIICATTQVIGDKDNPTFSYIPDPTKLVYWDSIPHPSSFIKRELLVQFPFREDLKIASDYDFFLKVFLMGTPFKTVPHQSAIHYYGGASSDANTVKAESDLILTEHLGWWRAYYYKSILSLWRKIRKIVH